MPFFLKQESLAPRAARNSKSYAEAMPPEINNKRKKKSVEFQDRAVKRRKADFSDYQPPALEGASAQARGWSYGILPKRDATRFSRAVRFVFYSFNINNIQLHISGLASITTKLSHCSFVGSPRIQNMDYVLPALQILI